MLKHLWKLVGMLGLAACSEDPFYGNDRKTEVAIYGGTAAAVAVLEPTRAAMQATVDAAPVAATQVANLSLQNQYLQATIMAGGNVSAAPAIQPTATQAVVQADWHYQNVTTASGVNSADGCAMDRKDTFYITGANDPTKIYFTTVAADVVAGTVYQTRWNHGAELRHESVTWTADQNYDQICIYFWLESSYTPFAGGFWLVELLANGTYVTGTRFAMCEPGLLC